MAVGEEDVPRRRGIKHKVLSLESALCTQGNTKNLGSAVEGASGWAGEGEELRAR